ncbi:MAG TPA: STAS domain-containing protein [Candidatus Binatia bacterium]|nr:STAS domain-containing protein [Candidatus Binatia bacterium]
MVEGHNRHGWEYPVTGTLPVHVVSLRGPQGERRLPIDIIKQELLSLPATTWIAFQGDALGEQLAYATDLMRRMGLLKHNWIARASLSLVAKPELLQLARQSGCRALSFDGEQISGQYLTTESLAPLETLSDLATSLRQLAAQGILSVARFVFGYDTDDEGVFERTVRFCLDARIGLPFFSVFTPHRQSPLFIALEREGRLLHQDFSRYDGSHVVFQPRLMTPEALENGLHWTRQHVYRQSAIWRRVFSWKRGSLYNFLANYEQRRLFRSGPHGVYTETMQLLSHLSRPIPVQEQTSFISTLKDAMGEKKRQLHGALLCTRAVRNEQLKALTLRLEGVLDASSATEVLERIHAAIRAGHQKVVLDLKGLELVSHTVITRFLEENAQTLVALRDRVVFRHLRTALDAIKTNLGGVLPNAELFELVTEEA